MRRTQAVQPLHIVLFLLGIALFTAAVFFILRTAQSHAESKRFTENIDRIDFLLSEEALEKAKILLGSTQTLADSSTDWLRLLKRGQSYSLKSGDKNFFRSLTLSAMKASPDSRKIRVLAAVALMDNQEDAEALSIAQGLSDEREYRTILAEAYLRAGIIPEKNNKSSEENSDDGLELARLSRTSSPQDFLRAGESTGNSNYLLNAGLLFLGRGDISAGSKILSQDAVSSQIPLPAVLANLDAGSLEEASRILKFFQPSDSNLALLSLLSADIALRSKKDAEALENYTFVRKTYPAASMVSFLNEAYFRSKDALSAALAILREGVLYFPGERPLALALIRLSIVQQQFDTAMRTLSMTEYQSPADADTRLMRLLIERPALPPGRFIGELWALRNLNPAHEDSSRLLIEQLFGTADYSSLATLLSAQEAALWVSFYRGVLSFAQNRFEEAAEHFHKAVESQAFPQALFNEGLAHLAENEVSAALRSFTAAEKTPDKEDVQGRSLVLMAECYLRKRAYSEAAAAADTALLLNPQNHKAKEILRKLEALSNS